MSFDVSWDIDKYQEDHESDEHWQLRREFMERWKQDYPEDRLVCLARVFANIEFMGCRYPLEVMQEVSRLSYQITQSYRTVKKTKLQRTFVSASDAAVDRAKGIKRVGGVVTSVQPLKRNKIAFVKQRNAEEIDVPSSDEDKLTDVNDSTNDTSDPQLKFEADKRNAPEENNVNKNYLNDYLSELAKVKCIDVRLFNHNMFHTTFGSMVMLIRPWASKLWNIQASCQACNIQMKTSYVDGSFSVTLNGRLLASASGPTKPEAKSLMEIMAWNRLKQETITVLVKEQWIAQGDAPIGVNDVAGGAKEDQFGTPIESNVAIKMMRMMGWKGGGLGADAQGIEEPIKPNLQMVNRSGLGSAPNNLKRAASSLMKRFLDSDTFDLDLVFSSEFSKDERAALHKLAQQTGLASKSYGDKERFLVVRKKLDPFSLVHAVIAKGGNTPKYQVFIPAALSDRRRY